MNYDIIVIAGQSNAEGNGLGGEEHRLASMEGVFQLVDKNPISIYFDKNYATCIRAVLPTECMIEPADERLLDDGTHAAEFSQSFAREYVSHGYLKPGRALLIVKAALGGTGFTKKQWGVGNILYTRLLEMIEIALKTGADSKIVAFLWHQGEHDAFEQIDRPDEEVHAFYRAQFGEMLRDFRKRYARFDFPFIAGDFVASWAHSFPKPAVIGQAIRDVFQEIGNAAFVETADLLSNNDVIHNADIIHFCRESAYELGRRYFRAFELQK